MIRYIFSIAFLLLIASSAIVNAQDSDYDVISFDERDSNTTVYNVDLTTNQTVVLEVQGAMIQLSFPAVASAKAVYSEGTPEISGYVDPSNNGLGTFNGITFFVTLYSTDTNTVLENVTFQPPLMFNISDSGISSSDEVYYYDTVSMIWKNAASSCTGSDYMQNSASGSIVINVCHLTQFAVITPTPGNSVTASNSKGSKGWIAAVVIIPLFVVVVIIIVIALGVKGSRSRGRHQDIELNKPPTRASQPMAELSSDDESSEEEKVKENPKKTEESTPKPEEKAKTEEKAKVEEKPKRNSSSEDESSNTSDSE